MAKYLYSSILFALFSVVLFSCSDDDDFASHLNEVQVSNTMINLPQTGGDVTFTLTAKADWAFDEATIPEEFTVSPLSGAAGQHTITIHAEETELSHSAEMVIECAGKKQYLVVTQTGATFPEFKEGKYWIMFNTGEKWIAARPCTAEIGNGSSYAYIFCDDATGSFEDGTLASSAANVYTFTKTKGGFYVSDSEGGYLWQSGSYNNFYRATEGGSYIWSVTQVTEQGYLIESNTSHVLCYSTGYSNVAAYAALGDNLRPFLVPVKELAPEVITVKETSFTVPAEAGKLTVPATIEAESLSVDYDADWLRYQGNTAEGLVFSYTANLAGARSANVAVHGVYGDYEKDVELTITQSGSAGTLDMPMTPTEAIEFCRAIGSGSTSTSDLYIKGIISKVKYEFSAQYGTATFWISEDGTYDEENPDDNFQCYSVLYLGNQQWTEGNGQIELGAEVIICGKLTQYNNTSETASKKAYVYSVNGVTTDENGIGTLASPFNALGGIAAANAKTAAKVYVEGTVSELYKGGFDANYGNGSFFISVDGEYNNGDKAHNFEAYQINYLGNQKWNAETDPQIAIGDKVVVYGPLTVYNGQCETQGKSAAYLYMLNGKTE